MKIRIGDGGVSATASNRDRELTDALLIPRQRSVGGAVAGQGTAAGTLQLPAGSTVREKWAPCDVAAIYERGTSSMIPIAGDICVRLHRRTVKGIASKRARNERTKEGRKDNEGVERWIPRNHTPRRESLRRDSFLVTLRCLTGPMTSGRAMMEEPMNGTRGSGWIHPIDVWSYL